MRSDEPRSRAVVTSASDLDVACFQTSLIKKAPDVRWPLPSGKTKCDGYRWFLRHGGAGNEYGASPRCLLLDGLGLGGLGLDGLG